MPSSVAMILFASSFHIEISSEVGISCKLLIVSYSLEHCEMQALWSVVHLISPPLLVPLAEQFKRRFAKPQRLVRFQYGIPFFHFIFGSMMSSDKPA